MKKLILLLTATLLLSACSSAERDEQNRIEMLAKNRAAILSAGLPIKQGPLSIMRVTAKKSTVVMMMLYNTDSEKALPISQVVSQSKQQLCNNIEVKTNLEMGLSYQIELRSARGQLLVDEFITAASCASKK